MKKILFQPFDLKKGLVIGFAAWLSNLASGNYNYNYRGRSDWKDVPFSESSTTRSIKFRIGFCSPAWR